MQRRTQQSLAALFTMGLLALGGCATPTGGNGWVSLIDGERGFEHFSSTGQAEWIARDGAIEASRGGKVPGYLVSKSSYRDFELYAEFWASDDANSGIFVRCQDPATITDENCYEANIFDQRPGPEYGTGAIVKVAKVQEPRPKAGGKWNTYAITVRGDQVIVVLNGVETANVRDSRLKDGRIAVQWASGTIKFRKLELRPL